jgi:hypothetical protein
MGIHLAHFVGLSERANLSSWCTRSCCCGVDIVVVVKERVPRREILVGPSQPSNSYYLVDYVMYERQALTNYAKPWGTLYDSETVEM